MGKLYAGTAVRKITPSPEVLELIKTEGRYCYEGVAHDIFLKTLVLTDGKEKFVYFATDLSRFSMNPVIEKRFEDELGLKPGDYLFSTIRTHNTISGFGEVFHDPQKPGSDLYATQFYEAAIDSCKEAMAHVVPARIGAAEGRSYISCHREQFTPAGNLESTGFDSQQAPWLRVARVEDLTGNTLALLVNYSMQNCMVCWYSQEGEDYNLVTNDTAGEIVDYLEKVGKHTYPVFWGNGGGADRQPYMYLLDYCDVNDDGEYFLHHEIMPIEGSLKIMKLLAAQQARDVMQTVDKIKEYSDRFDLYKALLVKQVPGKRKLSTRIHIYHNGDDVTPEAAAPVKLRLQMAVVNGIAFCAANGPTYSGVYKAVKDMMPFAVTFFFDDCLGGPEATTVPTPDMEEEGKYVHATLQSTSYTARMGFNALMSGFGQMLEKYTLQTNELYGGAPYPDDAYGKEKE